MRKIREREREGGRILRGKNKHGRKETSESAEKDDKRGRRMKGFCLWPIVVNQA